MQDTGKTRQHNGWKKIFLTFGNSTIYRFLKVLFARFLFFCYTNYLDLRAFLSKYWYMWWIAYSLQFWPKVVFSILQTLEGVRDLPDNFLTKALHIWLFFWHRWMFLYSIPTVPADSSGLGSELPELMWRRESGSAFSIVFISLISQQHELPRQKNIVEKTWLNIAESELHFITLNLKNLGDIWITVSLLHVTCTNNSKSYVTNPKPNPNPDPTVSTS